MSTRMLARLGRLFGAARAAEASRLAALLSEIEACRRNALRLREEICLCQGAPGWLGDATDLVAASRWRERLAHLAEADDARAIELAHQVSEARTRLAQAFGREAAATDIADQARRCERGLAESRTEANVVPSGRQRV